MDFIQDQIQKSGKLMAAGIICAMFCKRRLKFVNRRELVPCDRHVYDIMTLYIICNNILMRENEHEFPKESNALELQGLAQFY